jgi:peptidoglycan/LPS O-acetylase OafA/YrhL
MLGILRFLLAYLVVVSHLVGGDYFAHFGFYAVRGFFVISGFLMTSVLNEVYEFDRIRFWTNRALRLLPPYFIVCGVTLAVIALLPSEAGQYLKFWRGGVNLRDVLLNFSILPLQLPDPSFRLVPPYWSVAIEIEMYLLLYVIVARRMAWAVVALIASLTYHLACTSVGVSWAAYYFTAPSAVLPFAVGAVLYFVLKGQFWTITPRLAALAFIAWFANMLVGGWIFSSSYIFGFGYYLDTILFTVVVAGLAGRRFYPFIRRVDKVLGEWAYFVFLVQWLAGFAVVLAFHSVQSRGWAIFIAATPVAILASVALAFLNRKFVEPFRDRVRDLPSAPHAHTEFRGDAKTAVILDPLPTIAELCTPVQPKLQAGRIRHPDQPLLAPIIAPAVRQPRLRCLRARAPA